MTDSFSPIIRVIFWCVLLFSGHTQISANSDTPNVLIIMTDDQGWGDLSIHGNQTLKTPNLDQLACEGIQLDRFFVQPVCSPTRAEVLTGRYYPRSGVYGTGAGAERMDADETTLADILKCRGYRTAYFGKWHNGTQFPYHPNARGFDEFYGFTSGHWGLYFDPMIDHNGSMTRAKGYLPDDLTNRTIDYIKSSREENAPWFVFLGYNIPHSPMQVPDDYWEKFESAELKQRGTLADQEDIVHTRAALAMCENIDWNVGRILEALEALELEEDTIVMFLSDNGPNGHRWNGGMKGIKGKTDEGGLRSPFFIRWPNGMSGGRTLQSIAGAIDLMPTVLDMVGVSFEKSDFEFDGKSLLQLFHGGDQQWDSDRELVSYWNNRVSIRNQRYRLDSDGKLFDMIEDPMQTHDLSSEQGDVWKQMMAVADEFRTSVVAGNLSLSKRPFPIGHPTGSITQLPARDAETEGEIERSNRWPNDSYFTNWKTTDDAIVWEVDVIESGSYEVDIWYACKEGDENTVLKLEFGETALVHKITESHDPEFLGAQWTRSDLHESPVKIFKKTSIGTILLKQQGGRLRLSAVEIPGESSIEFRLLTLTKIE